MSRLIDKLILDGPMSPAFAGMAHAIAFERREDGAWRVRKGAGYRFEDARTREALAEEQVLARCAERDWPYDVRVLRGDELVGVTAPHRPALA